MYFLQISDTHHLNDYQSNPDIFHDAFLQLTSHQKILEEIQKDLNKPLSLVLHCGDLAHHGEREDYQQVEQTLQNLFPDCMKIVTCGNHDKKDYVQEVFYGKKEQLFAHDHMVEGLRILSFDNTNGRYNTGEITEEMSRWLLDKLHEMPEQDTLLMSHHHCLSEQSAMPPASMHPLFQEVLSQPQVKALLTGHTHSQFHGTLYSVPYYTVGSHSFTAEELGGGALKVYQSSCYHLFSYENGEISLISEKNQGQVAPIGNAQKPQ